MGYDIDLSGRVALVTGASGGLGAQFARTLAKAGAGVVLAARRIERLKTLRAEIEAAGGDAHVVDAGRHRHRQHQVRGGARRDRDGHASTSWSTTPASAPRRSWST